MDDIMSLEYFKQEHGSQSEELQLWVNGDEDTVVFSYNFHDRGISVKVAKNDGGLGEDGSINANVYGVPIGGLKRFIKLVDEHMQG